MDKFENYRFEDLEIWKIGMEIVHEVYQIVREFPKNESFGLSDQLRRAAISIVLNIAEGSGQPSSKGFSVYLHRAKSSALECVACIKIAVQEKFITEESVKSVNQLFEKEYFKIIALEKSIKQR